MMYRELYDSSISGVPADSYPWGWMVNHMNWAIGPSIFGFGLLSWTAVILANLVLLLLAIFLWQLIKKNSRR